MEGDCRTFPIHPSVFTIYADALGADPKQVSDLKAGHGYNAACHAHPWLPSRGRTPPSQTDEELARSGPPHRSKFASMSSARRTDRHAHPYQAPQRAPIGHACVSSCRRVRRGGPTDRGDARKPTPSALPADFRRNEEWRVPAIPGLLVSLGQVAFFRFASS
jgi:hypothetical protein